MASSQTSACVPAGLSPSGEVQNILDAGVQAPDEASPRSDAGTGDAPAASGTSQPAQDSAVPAGDAAIGDAGTSADGDAATSGDAGAPAPSCPTDNPCKAPYDCVPTALGYTCRGQFADWPMPDPTAGAKVAPSYSSNSVTVVDNVTELEWQIGIPTTYPGCTGMRMDGQLGDLCARLEARQYCADLTIGGHDDWRLPTLVELVSLLDTQRALGAEGINSGYFGDLFWASLRSAEENGVDFSSGELSYDVDPAYVRCVR